MEEKLSIDDMNELQSQLKAIIAYATLLDKKLDSIKDGSLKNNNQNSKKRKKELDPILKRAELNFYPE